ncbi:MAG: DUF2608 domain-containing protein [Kangiellaceae bacterium]
MQKQISLDNPNAEDTLIIFDIDDTLLESVNFVGSGKWYDWQRGKKVYDPSGHSFVINKEQQFHCIFRTLGTTFEMGSTKLTQKNAVSILNQLKQFDLLILTARTAKYRQATKRELKKHQIDLSSEHFSETGKGLEYQFNDGNRTARVTYQNGSIMLSGLNKGLVLEDFLQKTNRQYKNIYFIDDSLKNINNMKDVWSSKLGVMKIFHYTHVDKSISKSEIAESEKAKYHFDNFVKSAYSDQFKKFQNNSCD